MRLQMALASAVQSPGHVPFAKYRAFKNSVRESSEPFRFVDGELIEKFLDCPEDMQQELAATVTTPQDPVDVEGLKAMVESLRKIH